MVKLHYNFIALVSSFTMIPHARCSLVYIQSYTTNTITIPLISAGRHSPGRRILACLQVSDAPPDHPFSFCYMPR